MRDVYHFLIEGSSLSYPQIACRQYAVMFQRMDSATQYANHVNCAECLEVIDAERRVA